MYHMSVTIINHMKLLLDPSSTPNISQLTKKSTTNHAEQQDAAMERDVVGDGEPAERQNVH